MSIASSAARTNYGALEGALRNLENSAAVVAGILMLLAALLTSADALLRYTVNAPIFFVFYVTENYLMVGMITLPMAWGFRTGGSIMFTAILRVLPAGLGHLVLRVGLVVGCAYAAALAWFGGRHFVEALVDGDVQMGVIDWPVWISWVWIPIGLGLLALRLLATACGPASQLTPGQDHDAQEDL